MVRFVGVSDTQRTYGKTRVGVELDSACGKHNGTVDGHTYFKCAEKHGLLVPIERVTLLAHGEVRASSPPDDFGFGSDKPSENPAQQGFRFGSAFVATSERGRGEHVAVQGGGGDSDSAGAGEEFGFAAGFNVEGYDV